MKKFICFFSLTLFSGWCLAQVPDSTQKPPAATDTIQQAPPPPATPPAEPPKEGRTFSEKFAIGLGTGFWFNSRTTYIEVSPSIAYLFPKRLTTGVGYRYIYQHDKKLNNDLHSHGPNVFARLDLLKRIYFWTEYEFLNNQYFVESNFSNDYERETESTDSWFVGLGYQRSLGRKGRGGISVQVLYNTLYDQHHNSPYYSAWIYRIGYFF